MGFFGFFVGAPKGAIITVPENKSSKSNFWNEEINIRPEAGEEKRHKKKAAKSRFWKK